MRRPYEHSLHKHFSADTPCDITRLQNQSTLQECALSAAASVCSKYFCLSFFVDDPQVTTSVPLEVLMYHRGKHFASMSGDGEWGRNIQIPFVHGEPSTRPATRQLQCNRQTHTVMTTRAPNGCIFATEPIDNENVVAALDCLSVEMAQQVRILQVTLRLGYSERPSTCSQLLNDTAHQFSSRPDCNNSVAVPFCCSVHCSFCNFICFLICVVSMHTDSRNDLHKLFQIPGNCQCK